MATYDPVSTATSLAENYVYARQAQVDTGSSKAQSQVSALNSLKSSLSSFTSALSSLSGKGSVVQQTSSVSNASAASASVTSKASAGSYAFQVTQLATAQQSLYDLNAFGFAQFAAGTQPEAMAAQRTMVVSLGDGGFFAVDLSKADADSDGKLSASEVARAINASSEGRVSAAVMTVDGQPQLLLNGGNTGVSNQFSLAMADRSAYQSYIATAGDAATKDSAALIAALGSKISTQPVSRAMSEAKDAQFTVGDGSGQPITQASNTYTGIEGLTVDFKEVTSAPMTVTVAKDESGTRSNMQGFVDAYNTLVKAIDKLTASGNAEGGVAAGPFSGDSGVRSLRSQLNNLLRTPVGGVSLMEYGISAQRDGTIALDGDRFSKKVATNPEALDGLLGQTNTLEYKRSGVLGALQGHVDKWTKTTGGLLQTRQDGLQKQLSNYDKQQDAIERMYQQAYQRYLLQFTTLANLESQMGNTSSMLTSIFSSSAKS